MSMNSCARADTAKRRQDDDLRLDTEQRYRFSTVATGGFCGGATQPRTEILMMTILRQ